MSRESNYWKKYWSNRYSRRRVVRTAAFTSAGLAALGLVGCGDDDDDDDAGGSTPSGGASPEATSTSDAAGSATEESTAEAGTPKRGGTLRMGANVDNRALDPYSTSAATVKGLSTYVFSRLYRIRPEKPGPSGAGTMTPEPDAAESVEVSSDGLAYTIKLRDNVRWHPPVNRNMTAEDVVFSWDRFTGRLPGTTPAVNSEKLTFIDSVQALDEKTVLFTLNRKYGPFFSFLSDTTTLALMPKETGTDFDPAQVQVGSGPWMFDSWEPNVRYRFKRFDDWHLGPDAPYLDAVEINIVPEYTQRLNNFLSGNLDHLAVDGLDFARVKSQIPDVQAILNANTNTYGVSFSHVTDVRPDAPWTDVRVRRAMSMAINREELIEIGYNASALEAEGLQLPEMWGAYVPPVFTAAYVHPLEGAAAEYMKYDPDAARALLEEAGGGFSTKLHYAPAYGRVPTTAAELIIQYMSEIGIELTAEPEDYPSQFVPFTYRGEFDGVTMAGQGGFPDPGNFLEGFYSAESERNPGRVEDPKVQEYIEQYYGELDDEKRIEIIRDWQNYLYEQLYTVPTGMIGDSIAVAYQPYMRGMADHVTNSYGFGGESTPYFWRDE